MAKCYICGKGEDEKRIEVTDIKNNTHEICVMCMMSSMRIALNDPTFMVKVYVDSSYMRGVFGAIEPQFMDFLKEENKDGCGT